MGGGLGRTQSSAGKKVESTVDGWTNIVEGHDRETNRPRTSSFAPNPPVPLCPCTPRPPATPRLSPGYHRTALYPVRPWVRWQGPHGRKGGEGRVDRVYVHGRTGSGAPVLLSPVRLRALSNLLTYIISGGRMRRTTSENNTRRAGLRTQVERPRNIAQRLLFGPVSTIAITITDSGISRGKRTRPGGKPNIPNLASLASASVIPTYISHISLYISSCKL